jgi:sulfatase modifying factor 1
MFEFMKIVIDQGGGRYNRCGFVSQYPMKHPICSVFGFAALVSVSLVNSAYAVVNIAYVPVGNPGNPADTADGDYAQWGVQRYGAVPYEYQIAKNETTIGQYCEFLNAKAKTDPYGLYNTNMTLTRISGISRSGSAGSYLYAPVAGTANKPITYVSWFDAARFCNWLHNGQGSGNTIGVPNSANYNDGDYASSPGRLTDVGAYGANSDSFYGTNDQAGNVLEWNDAVMSGTSRGLRGGCWIYSDFYDLGPASSASFNFDPSVENFYAGFRVAAVPEPSCMVLSLLASGMLATRRKR